MLIDTHTHTHTHTHTERERERALPCVLSIVFDSIVHPHVESIILFMKLKGKGKFVAPCSYAYEPIGGVYVPACLCVKY